MTEKFEIIDGSVVTEQILENVGCDFLNAAYRAILEGQKEAACYACNVKLSRNADGDVIVDAKTGGCLAK